MAPDGTEPQTGRETRLLMLVVGVAVAVLLLLAQWQFPGSSMSGVAPGGAPLVGLTARASFDEMAGTMADVIGRVSPLTVAIPLEALPAALPAGQGRGAGRSGTSAPEADDDVTEAPPARPVAWALAVRVARDLALARLPDGFDVQAGPAATVSVVAHDIAREMVLVRVPASTVSPDTLSASVRSFPSFSYVAAVDATAVGPTAQPVFVGRADTVSDPRWSHPLVPAAIAPGLVPGAIVFSLNGRLVGIVVGGDRGPMVVPAPAIEALVQALTSAESAAP